MELKDKFIGYQGKIKEKINVYEFNQNRNKCVLSGRGVQQLKRIIEKKKGSVCYLCNKTFERLGQLELEHKIPVEIGGKIFCLSNLDLVCNKCHQEKSIIDRKVIKIMKSMKILTRAINTSSFYPLEKLKEIYLYLKEIIEDCDERYKKWDFGFPGEDYNQVFDTSNREVLE
jgi:hypothetical protein